jgi:hypothetical protein
MPKRNYSSTVIARKLGGPMSSSSTDASDVMILDSTATVPTAYPFTMVIDPDTTSEEIVTVTAAPTGYSYPVKRGQDGTSATAHLNNSVVRHMVTARDLQEPQNHIYATADVHGLDTAGPSGVSGGTVVGTSAQQSLTNKTISASTLSGTITASAATVNSPTISGSTISGSTTINGTVTNNATVTGGTYTTPTIASIKNAAGTAYITDTDANFTVGSNGSIINKSYFYQLGAARTLTSTSTVAQSIFGKALTLPETGPTNTLYHFEAKFRLTNGTTSHSVYFQLNSLGTGTISVCDLTLWACDVSGIAANASVGVTNITSSTSTQEIITSSTSNATYVTVIGTFVASSGTTLNPAIRFSIAPGTPVTVATNAYVKVTPIAAWTSGADTSRGSWA